MTKDELLKELWPDSFVEESNLAYHVFALRRALGETPDGGRYVETVPKHGYRFVAPVTPANGANVDGTLGSATDADGADLEQEKAVELEPHESESRDQSSEASRHGEQRGANPARDRQGASRFFSRKAALSFAAGACSAAVVLVLIYDPT